MEKSLTYDECDIIIEAIEKWEEDSDFGGMIMSTIMGSMVDDPEAKAEIEKQQEERKREKELQRKERKRKAAKLKSKIYEIQDLAIKRENGVPID